MNALTQSVIELIEVHGLPALMRVVADACDVEADTETLIEEDSTALNGIGLQIRELADECEVIVGSRS